MESATPTRVLIVAHGTATNLGLLDAVRSRAAQGAVRFTLLVPRSAHGLHEISDAAAHDDTDAREILARALPLLSAAAGAPVNGLVGDADPLVAVGEAISRKTYEEIILSTLPAPLSRWQRLDLPAKLAGFGIPVRVVAAGLTQAAVG